MHYAGIDIGSIMANHNSVMELLRVVFITIMAVACGSRHAIKRQDYLVPNLESDKCSRHLMEIAFIFTLTALLFSPGYAILFLWISGLVAFGRRLGNSEVAMIVMPALSYLIPFLLLKSDGQSFTFINTLKPEPLLLGCAITVWYVKSSSYVDVKNTVLGHLYHFAKNGYKVIISIVVIGFFLQQARMQRPRPIRWADAIVWMGAPIELAKVTSLNANGIDLLQKSLKDRKSNIVSPPVPLNYIKCVDNNVFYIPEVNSDHEVTVRWYRCQKAEHEFMDQQHLGKLESSPLAKEAEEKVLDIDGPSVYRASNGSMQWSKWLFAPNQVPQKLEEQWNSIPKRVLGTHTNDIWISKTKIRLSDQTMIPNPCQDFNAPCRVIAGDSARIILKFIKPDFENRYKVLDTKTGQLSSLPKLPNGVFDIHASMLDGEIVMWLYQLRDSTRPSISHVAIGQPKPFAAVLRDDAWIIHHYSTDFEQAKPYGSIQFTPLDCQFKVAKESITHARATEVSAPKHDATIRIDLLKYDFRPDDCGSLTTVPPDKYYGSQPLFRGEWIHIKRELDYVHPKLVSFKTDFPRKIPKVSQ